MTTALATVTSTSIVVNVGDDSGLLGDTVIHVDDFKGWYGGGSGVRKSAKSRLIAHGQFAERGYRDASLITLDGIAWAPDRAGGAKLVDLLSSLLADGNEGTLTVNDPDMGTRAAKVSLYGPPKITWDTNTDVEFSIDMLAADPRKYSPIRYSSTGTAVGGSGLALPLFASGVLDFGSSSGSTGMVTLVNNGTADASPVFQVFGYAPGFTITRTGSGGTGARIVYGDTVQTGSYVLIDSSDGSVMLDGYNDRSGQLDVSEFETLAKGESATWLFESPGNTNAQLQVGLADAWW
jgi:hypothetical protein